MYKVWNLNADSNKAAFVLQSSFSLNHFVTYPFKFMWNDNTLSANQENLT